MFVYVREGWGPPAAARATPQLKGGIIPKVTHITSGVLCPDTPLTLFCLALWFSLAVRLSAGLVFITIKGQMVLKDRGHKHPAAPVGGTIMSYMNQTFFFLLLTEKKKWRKSAL